MVEQIVNTILNIFNGLEGITFGKEILVFLISLMPILELRGGLIAAALLDVNPVISYIICIIGNVLPVPFILWFINSILNWMRNSKHFSSIANWLDSKVTKHKAQIEKYGFWGMVLFVGIPLPGTGAWTGTLAASLLDMDFKKSVIAIIAGVILAGIIMGLASAGVFGALGAIFG